MSLNQPPQNKAVHPTKANKVISKIAFIAIGIAGLGIGLLLFWSFQPDDVLTIHNNPVPVRTIRKNPTADGVVILKIDYCKHIEAHGRLRYSFVSNSREIFLPISEDKQPPVCKVTELPIVIPHETPPDEYKVKFRIEYQVNPLKRVVEEFESLPFTVTEEVN